LEQSIETTRMGKQNQELETIIKGNGSNLTEHNLSPSVKIKQNREDEEN